MDGRDGGTRIGNAAMTDTPGGESTKPDIGKGGKGRQRPQPVVDLPAEAVTEIVEASPPPPAGEAPASDPASVVEQTPPHSRSEPAVEPQEAAPPADPLPPPPVLPPPATPSRAVPALVGLVAGLVGGVAASQLAPALLGSAPTTDPALVGRVAQLEQQARAVRPPDPAGQKLESLMVELPKREAALKAEIAALKQALESRPMPLASTPSVPPAEVEAMKTRIGAIEDGLKAVPQGVNQLGSRVDALQPRVESVARDLQGLATRLGSLGARDALSAANARLAAVTLAEEAFARNRPLGPALELLKGVLPDAAVLGSLQPYAEKPPETPADLVAALKAAAPKPAASASSGTGSWSDRLRQTAMSFVEIRKTGDVSGADDQSALRRAELAVQRADLPAALVATAKLSPALAPAYADWRTLLERQVKAREALVQLRQDAMTALARTAQAAK